MNSIVQQKSEDFAVRIINLYRYLNEKKHEHTLSKQILKSGTSIGANLAEAECAISRNDFLSKAYIAYKESGETMYWLRMLYRANYISKVQYESLLNDCEEIKKMLASITKTTRENSSPISK